MEFSGISYCAENKKLNFPAFPLLSSGTIIHQTSNMGANHSKELPFVELTGHKVSESLSHRFEMNELTGGFGLASKIHTFSTNTRHFVRSENFLMRKELYGQQFPAFAFSQLVGGFVGSKSQIGSSSKEACQIWDIVFDKLAEFCGSHQHHHNFDKAWSEQVIGSFCQKNIQIPSQFVVKNSVGTATTTNIKPEIPKRNIISSQSVGDPSVVAGVSVTDSSPSLVSSSSADVPDCASLQTFDITKQSYADVARTFAVHHQKNKEQTSATMPRTKNPPHRRNLTKCQINRPIDNRRNQYNRCRKDYQNHTKFFSGFKNKPRPDCNQNYKTSANNEVRGKADKITQYGARNFQRVEKAKTEEMVSNRVVQNSPQYCRPPDCLNICGGVDSRNSRESSSFGDAKIDIQSSPPRKRFISECSTDSEDSFVIFDAEGECDSVIAAVVSDSEISEDLDAYEFSEDDDDDEETDVTNTDDSDDDDVETVTGLGEINERWQRENSAYSATEKAPVKVQFASESSLTTVHPMVAWNYAYRAARSGPWEEMARDRERFRTRVKQVESVLSPVLTPEHRSRVWRERMTS